ncbi:MAG TPA: PEP-utilizing enzyme, partial [Kofleriaceae bacterium]|nr:PEP-utilizing enzyme [Kofleriaceae bacterium]
WDVAAPSWGERPDALRAAVARAGRRQRTAAIDPLPALRARVGDLPGLDQAVALARAARELGDQDDLLFGRAQHVVRRALLALGRRWRLPNPDDVFYLRLPETDEPPAPARDLAGRAAAARALQRAQRALAMPLSVRAGRPLPEPPRGGGELWRGRGAGGRATGPAWLLRPDRLDAAPDGAVVVAAALTPAMVVGVRGAAALVSEFGGLLGHGAALARELGIPCVVGCRDIRTVISDGERLWVDGAAGLVVRVARG